MLWGIYFAIFLVLEKFWLNKFFEKLPKAFSHVYVCFVIVISFVIFSANGISGAISDLGNMFGAGGIPFWNAETGYYLGGYAIALIVALLGSMPLLKNGVLKLKENEKINKVINVLEPIFVVAMLLIVTAYFVDGSFSPFLYFRF